MSASTNTRRIASVDILRGIIMVIMALDHTRDYFTDFYNDPTDLAVASTPMFLTRWTTHFCAPVFIFLSGTSAFLSFSKGKTKKEAALFLLTRGIWLIILEFTLVKIGWQFNLDYSMMIVQVIWAIGCSMVFLSALIFLPMSVILSIGLIMIFGHNAFDNMHAAAFGDNSIWWNIAHEFGNVPIAPGRSFLVIYPLVPWIGVMATGYCFGQILLKPETERIKWLYSIGLSAIVLFIALRYSNAYGDMRPWSPQGAWHRTILSYINCTKYPPSLLYLLMTIGPAIASMPILERMNNAVGRFFTVYGRVPLFYYLLHIYLIHSMAVIAGLFMHVPIDYFTDSDKFFGPKPNWGFSLVGVYMYWALAVLLLYFPCRWFMYLKMNHKKWWLSYL